MIASREIEGSPYSARFIAEEDGSVGESFAQAIIEPPFVFSEDSIAVKCTFKQTSFECLAKHVASTQTKTHLEIQVKDPEGIEADFEARMHIAYQGLREYVGYLNRLEDGTFDGITYSM